MCVGALSLHKIDKSMSEAEMCSGVTDALLSLEEAGGVGGGVPGLSGRPDCCHGDNTLL